MENILLVGNGINRVHSSRNSWECILNSIVNNINNNFDWKLPRYDNELFPVYFERIKKLIIETNPESCDFLEEEFRKHVEEMRPNNLHSLIGSKFEIILTTNFDFCIEDSIENELSGIAALKIDIKHNFLTTFTQKGKHRIYHVHGSIKSADPIILGSNDYLSFKNDINRYKSDPKLYGFSWFKHFLNDTVHIMAYDLSYHEETIGFVLNHRAKLIIDNQCQNEIFYYIRKKDEDNALSLELNKLFINVVTNDSEDFYTFYRTVIESI